MITVIGLLRRASTSMIGVIDGQADLQTAEQAPNQEAWIPCEDGYEMGTESTE
jgi:hypothetical protein